MGKIIKGMLKNDTIRIAAYDASELIKTIQKIHQLNEFTLIPFGRLMTAAAMISTSNKFERDSMVIKFAGDGPIGNMSAVIKGDGTLKGYISNPKASIDTFQIKDLLGNGFLTITKDLGLKNPYTGKVPLYKGDIINDLSYYYTISEQIPTAISIGISLDELYNVKDAVGIMIQALPGAEEMIADIISYRIEDLGNIGKFLEQGKNIYDILDFMFDDMDFKILEEKEIKYNCDCNNEKVERALMSIGKEELELILEENKTEEIVCDYCKKIYKFEYKDLKKIYEIICKKC